MATLSSESTSRLGWSWGFQNHWGKGKLRGGMEGVWGHGGGVERVWGGVWRGYGARWTGQGTSAPTLQILPRPASCLVSLESKAVCWVGLGGGKGDQHLGVVCGGHALGLGVRRQRALKERGGASLSTRFSGWVFPSVETRFGLVYLPGPFLPERLLANLAQVAPDAASSHLLAGAWMPLPRLAHSGRTCGSESSAPWRCPGRRRLPDGGDPTAVTQGGSAAGPREARLGFRRGPSRRAVERQLLGILVACPR